VEYRREINYSKINYSNNYGTEPKKTKKKRPKFSQVVEKHHKEKHSTAH
jgi:hypothetical protein